LLFAVLAVNNETHIKARDVDVTYLTRAHEKPMRQNQVPHTAVESRANFKKKHAFVVHYGYYLT